MLPTRCLQNYVTKVIFSFLVLASGRFYCLKNTLFQKFPPRCFSSQGFWKFGISGISNAEQHCFLGISKVKCAILSMCAWIVIYIIFECAHSMILVAGLSTTPLTVLYSASAFRELKSVEAFSHTAIYHVCNGSSRFKLGNRV